MPNLMDSNNLKETLIMLKPDVVDQKLVLPILMSLAWKFGFSINNMQVIEQNKAQAMDFYLNAHDRRLEQNENKLEKKELNFDEFVAEKIKFDEINNRNANFISSGKLIAIAVGDKNNNYKTNSDFIDFVREIVEKTLRPLYSSNHDKFTFACNGIHASDSVDALKRDVDFLEKFKIENRDLSNIFPKADLPSRLIPDDMNYSKSVLLKGFENEINSEDLKNICSNENGGKALNSVLKAYHIFLNNYALTPTVSNAILLKNATDFLTNGINEQEYKLKNEDQINALNNVFQSNILILNKSPSLLNIINLIDSKVSSVIDSTIGKNRKLYDQMITNKDFNLEIN